MHILRRSLVLAGALVAGVALVAAGTDAPMNGTAAAAAAAVVVPAPEPSPRDLKDALLKQEEFPEGTRVTTSTMAQAAASGRMDVPRNVRISPSICANLLESAVGDAGRISGWAQLGDTKENRRTDVGIGTIDGGLNLDRIRATADACRVSTVTLTDLGLTGILRMEQFDAPGLAGARALGVQLTVDFPGDDPLTRQMEALGASSQIFVSRGSTVATICWLDIFGAIFASNTVQQRAFNVAPA